MADAVKGEDPQEILLDAVDRSRAAAPVPSLLRSLSLWIRGSCTGTA